MSIQTETLVKEHEQKIKALETRVQYLDDQVKLLRAALENRDPGPDRTLRLNGSRRA